MKTTEEKRAGIYKITNVVNGKCYVGSAIRIRNRQMLHLSQLQGGAHHSIALQRAWAKYGMNAFAFEVIEIVSDKADLLRLEQSHIDRIKPQYNISPTAGSSLGVKRRQETVDKCRKRMMGVKRTPESEAKRIASQSGVNHWTATKKFSDEAKAKMSASAKEYLKNNAHPNQKEVIQLDLGGNEIGRFASAASAARFYGVTPSAIIGCVNGKSKTSINSKWKYA